MIHVTGIQLAHDILRVERNYESGRSRVCLYMSTDVPHSHIVVWVEGLCPSSIMCHLQPIDLGNLAGRLVTRTDIACSVKQGLGDVFRMGIQPEFQDSIVDERTIK